MANLPVPIPRTFTVGETETAAFLNTAIRDATTFLLNPPQAVINQGSAVTSCAANNWTSIGFDTTVIDGYGGHSNVTNNSRYTAIVAGVYFVIGVVSFASSSASSRGARIAKNGSLIQGTQELLAPSSAFPTTISSAALLINLNAGDYVEVQGFPGNISLNTQIGADGSTSQLVVDWRHA